MRQRQSCSLLIVIALSMSAVSALPVFAGINSRGFGPDRWLPGSHPLTAISAALTHSAEMEVDKPAAGTGETALGFSTTLGGSKSDSANAVAVDASGNIYVTGSTYSDTFPLASGRRANSDAFVSKFDAAGTLVYTTIIASAGNDAGRAIVVDSSGVVSVAGSAGAAGLSVTADALQPNYSGLEDAFLARLDSSGHIIYCTYLGGAGSDTGAGLAVDDGRNLYVAGYTSSLQFPVTTGAPQSAYAGGGYDAFLLKIDPAGKLVYSTLLGGPGIDLARAVAVRPDGSACIGGFTDSASLPSSNTIASSRGRGGDALVACLAPSGSQWEFVRFLGGDGQDDSRSLVADATGALYVTGATASLNFPVTVGAFQVVKALQYDAFVSKLSPDGTTAVFSTLLGGTGSDTGVRIALDGLGRIWGAGFTTSPNLPAGSGAGYRGGNDAFVYELSADGAKLLYLGYLGGAADDSATGMALDSAGGTVICGSTASADFTTTVPGGTPVAAGDTNAFLVKIAPCNYTLSNATVSMRSVGGEGTVSVLAGPGCSWIAETGTAWLSFPGSRSGTGSGSISFSVSGYTGAVPRTGVITIGGQALAISQTAPISNNEAFVRQLYLDLLNREPDAGGLNYWLGELTAGHATRQQIAYLQFWSEEFRGNGLFVISVYRSVLGRDADFSGWLYYIGRLRSGTIDPIGLTASLVGSPEFQRTYGPLSDPDFVRRVYLNVLGREPDAGGMAYWTGRLTARTVTRERLVYDFTVSAEFQDRIRNRALATLLYMGFLRRSPEPGGCAYWTDALDRGMPPGDVLNHFILSEEYLQRF